MSLLPDWFVTLGTVTLTVIMVFFLLFVALVIIGVAFGALKDLLTWIDGRAKR